MYWKKRNAQVLTLVRTDEERARRHMFGDKGAKFSASKIRLPRTDGISNTITSVLKDNLLLEYYGY